MHDVHDGGTASLQNEIIHNHKNIVMHAFSRLLTATFLTISLRDKSIHEKIDKLITKEYKNLKMCSEFSVPRSGIVISAFHVPGFSATC